MHLIEIRNPIRALDYAPPPRTYREVSPGHVVQTLDESWAEPAAAVAPAA